MQGTPERVAYEAVEVKPDEDPRKFEMPGTKNVCRGQLEVVSRANPGERPCTL